MTIAGESARTRVVEEKLAAAECLDCTWKLIPKRGKWEGQGALQLARRHTYIHKHRTLVHRTTSYSPKPEQEHGERQGS